jgi:Asp-tRNA(Asn)/Glu-tRNA(Gln) amidotransferase A subunit family amidase
LPIGTETLGSIVSPSSTCGATGLRPTFGSISRTGAMTLSWSMDKTGPICRSAEDAAIVFNYVHGADGKDMCAVDHAFNYANTVDVKQLKIGYAKNYFRDLDSTANEWKVLDEFRRLGVAPVPVDFVDSNAFKLSVWSIVGLVLDAESAAAFDEFTRSNLDDEMTAQTKSDVAQHALDIHVLFLLQTTLMPIVIAIY